MKRVSGVEVKVGVGTTVLVGEGVNVGETVAFWFEKMVEVETGNVGRPPLHPPKKSAIEATRMIHLYFIFISG
jgi:hypothetical protein